VTSVDANGTPTRAFGGWGDGTFHEVDLTSYNGGIQDNIIGTGDMSGLASTSLEAFMQAWNGRAVAPDWDGARGSVCIDAATATDAYGGNTLRNAMRADYEQRPGTYQPIPLDAGGSQRPNPADASFYRSNPWLQRFFVNTGRYTRY
jgi:hypothetical protein